MKPESRVMTALRMRRGSVQAGGSSYTLASIGCSKRLRALLCFRLYTCTWQGGEVYMVLSTTVRSGLQRRAFRQLPCQLGQVLCMRGPHQSHKDALSNEAEGGLDAIDGPVGRAAMAPVALQQLERHKHPPAHQQHHHLSQSKFICLSKHCEFHI